MADAPKGGGGFSIPPFAFELVVLAVGLLFLMYQFGPSLVSDYNRAFQNAFIARLVFVMKIISGAVTLAAVAGIGYVVRKNAEIARLPKAPSRPIVAPVSDEHASNAPFAADWKALREKLQISSDNDAAFLVIEADALVDRALKSIGISGETMGERMKAISGPDFKSTDDLWEAHKMRNEIAHGDRKNVLYVDALYAIEKFEKAMKELNMI